MRRLRARSAVALAIAILCAAHGREARAATAAEVFDQANEAYAEGRYQEAATAYARILGRGIADPRVHYNLGNAYFKQGRLGPAILHYERALRLDPADREARDNLAFARGRIRDRVAEPEVPYPVALLKSWLDAVPLNGATLAFLLAYGATMACLGAMPLTGASLKRRALGYGAAGTGLVALLLGAGFAYKAVEAAAPYAIVMQDRVDVLSGPAQDNTILFTVHEGTRLEVRTRRAAWLQVSLPNALSGWVPAAAVERV